MSALLLLLIFSTMMSIIFMFLKHPLTMGLTLMFQTLLICSMSSLSTSFSWFSYILFMIFLGATLVLFIYIASLASNEMTSMSGKLSSLIVIPATSLPLLLIMDQLTLPTKTSTEMSFISKLQTSSSPLAELSMIYNPTVSNSTMFIILYLLLTLLIVVKLSSTFYGPLRLS